MKNSSAAVKPAERRTRVQVRTLCPREAQTLTDTLNIRSVKVISTLLAGWRRPTAAGWSDGVTYEERQDGGVALGRGERQRGEEMAGDGLENGHLLG